MSGIFGILHLDGRPVEPASLERMKQAMAGWGPDGSGLWVQGPVGLGHLMLHNTPEALHETLPLQSETGHIVLTAGARLDNRADLFRSLHIPSAEQTAMPDSTLLLKAYEKWGTACPKHLLGDWALAVWDAERRQMFLARDHFGYSGLYYFQSSRIFVFASFIKGILALPEVPRHLNPEGLLGERQWLGHGRSSLYEGILRLTPAQSLIVTPSGSMIQPYWHPAEAPDVRFSSDQDYLDAFLDLYSEAVRCRLRSHRPLGVMLSGGLDSGSVATLAAQELAQRGQHLYAFSSVPQFPTSEAVTAHQRGDETPAIEAICHRAGHIDLTYIRAQDVSPLDGLERVLDILGQPMNEPMNLYWAVSLLETAQRRGLGTLLTGGGGNLTVSWAGEREEYLRSLLSQGQWRAFVREVDAWRQVHHASLWRTIKGQVAKPLLPRSWQRSGRRWRAQAPEGEQPSAQRRWLYEAFDSSILAPWFELGAHFGLEVRDPTVDLRVLTFCLGLPPEQYTRNGQTRLLIRRAMAGRMPESALWDERHGKQAADIIPRLRASQGQVAALLQELEESALARQYVDLPHIKGTFAALQQRVDPELTDEVRFRWMRGLMIALFLHRMEARVAL